MNRPQINVTPLIDVLLVLLIIFMVVSPIKPSAFKARVPSEQRPESSVEPHPETIIVSVTSTGSLFINREAAGTTSDTTGLVERLSGVFAERIANGSVSSSFADDPARPFSDRIERTVFVKAPKNLDYGSVARIVDAVKVAGAYPISLQVDDLE